VDSGCGLGLCRVRSLVVFLVESGQASFAVRLGLVFNPEYVRLAVASEPERGHVRIGSRDLLE
jgi:hypothetical protein